MAKVEGLTKDFLDALAEIEFQYITFFIAREPRMPDDTFDKLKNHYWFAIEKGTPVFGFIYESDLPAEIRIRCLANYAHFFPEGYIYGHTF